MGNYIKDLREEVGSRPLVLCGAGTLLLDERERLLLVLRTDNRTWGIPGGFLEPGENLEETARRELEEETGLNSGKLDLFAVFSGPEFYYQYPNGDEVYNVLSIFVCRDFEGSPVPDGKETSQIGWFSPENLPPKINPVDRRILARFSEREKL